MGTAETGPKLVTLLLSVTIICLGAGEGARAATVHVANNGIDGADCGTAAAPCRSITQGIAVAAPGATIVVGPGAYGDVDGNGQLGDPGEESAASEATVLVDKTLTIVSSHGAGSTVIDATHSRAAAAVSITASDVVFGRKNRGFTLVHPGADGLHVEPGAAEVSLSGNVALNARVYGFVLRGSGAVVRDNWALRVPNGFYGEAGSVAVLEGNVASGSSVVGFTFFDIGGASVRRNVATNGGIGFYLGFAQPALAGLSDFSWNTFTANKFYGLRVDAFDLPEHGFTHSMSDNNFYGNGALTFSNYPNCGLVVNNYSSQPFTVDAANNYWGGPRPGGDPADDADGACNYGNGLRVETMVPAAREFRAKLKPMR